MRAFMRAAAMAPAILFLLISAVAAENSCNDLKATDHELALGDRRIAYQARAGTLPVVEEESGRKARIFFVDYRLTDGGPAERPLTFVFNGGPGAAAAWLHLGALGPRRLDLPENGGLKAPPIGLTDNLETWLTFTDLVFVDPVGSGYSRAVDPEDQFESGRGEAFWGYKQDLESLADFIRLYLTRFDRWMSPKFLAGESYGGLRAAALPKLLQSFDYGIAINGVALISPALDMGLGRGPRMYLLPNLLRLPPYAASARRHGVIQAPEGRDFEAFMEAVEEYALTEALPRLAQGRSLPEEQRRALYEELSRLIGLPADYLQDLGGLPAPHAFARRLLADQDRLISVYDGAYAGPDPDPGSPHYPLDPFFDQLGAAFTAAANAYIRDELKYDADSPYLVLNTDVFHKWDWRGEGRQDRGYLSAADDLAMVMNARPPLPVMVTGGYYDLITSYFAAVYLFNQLPATAGGPANPVRHFYQGGHMFYTRADARRAFTADAAAFYRGVLGKASAGEGD